MESIAGSLIPIGTIVLIVLVQISFWFPTGITTNKERVFDEQSITSTAYDTSIAADEPSAILSNERSTSTPREPTEGKRGRGVGNVIQITPQTIPLENFQCIFITDNKSDKKAASTTNSRTTESSNSANDGGSSNSTAAEQRTTWKCSCELGFFPAGMLKTFGNAEAMMRLGVGQCYHKQA